MTKANKVQSVYIDAKRAELKPGEIARDLKCSVDIVKKYIQDNPIEGKTVVETVAAPDLVSKMKQPTVFGTRNGITVMNQAASELGDAALAKKSSTPTPRTDCVTKAKK